MKMLLIVARDSILGELEELLRDNGISAYTMIDLPGLIWSSLNDRLDRNQGGHGHVQETVHARRDSATSADG